MKYSDEDTTWGCGCITVAAALVILLVLWFSGLGLKS